MCVSLVSPAKVLNLVVLFSSFCAFVGCCVAFGGDLFRAKVETSSGPFEWYFYQSAVQTEANRVYYSNGAFCVWSFCDQCSSGGKGFLALMVLSFVLLLFLMVVTVFRVMGGVAISAIAHPARSILVESWMTTAATLLYFIGVVVYGSTCYRAVQNTPAFTVTISGFGQSTHDDTGDTCHTAKWTERGRCGALAVDALVNGFRALTLLFRVSSWLLLPQRSPSSRSSSCSRI